MLRKVGHLRYTGSLQFKCLAFRQGIGDFRDERWELQVCIVIRVKGVRVEPQQAIDEE